MATTTAVILGRSTTENLFYSSNIVIYIKLWICMFVCVCQGLVLCRKVPLGVSGPLNSLNKKALRVLLTAVIELVLWMPPGRLLSDSTFCFPCRLRKASAKTPSHTSQTHTIPTRPYSLPPPVDRWAVCPVLVKGALWFYPLWSGFCHQLPSLMWVSRVRSQGRCPGIWHQQATHNT